MLLQKIVQFVFEISAPPITSRQERQASTNWYFGFKISYAALEIVSKCSTLRRTNPSALPSLTKQTEDWKSETLLHKETEQGSCFAVKASFEEGLGR